MADEISQDTTALDELLIRQMSGSLLVYNKNFGKSKSSYVCEEYGTQQR